MLAAVVTAALVVGCASESSDDAGGAGTEEADDDSSAQPEAPEAEAADDDGAPPSDPAAGTAGPLGAHPCDVVDDEAIDDVTGAPLDFGQEVTATVTENNLTWTPDACRWEDRTLEVSVQVAGADDFATGQIECPEPLGIGSEVTAADDLGDSGWWKYDDNDGEGTLRVCTATALVDVEVAPDHVAPIDEADARAIATSLAETVLAAL